MVKSKAMTVEAYLAELEPARRAVLEPVLDCVRAHLPPGYEEAMAWGMIAWQIPLARFPKTYNTLPLMYCSLAAQKNYYAVYLMSVYPGGPSLRLLQDGYAAAGVKLDMGKCCVRFKSLEGIHLPTIGAVVAATPVDTMITYHDAALHRKS